MFVPTRNFLEKRCRGGPSSLDPAQATSLVHAMEPLGRVWLRPEIVATANAYVGAAPTADSLPAGPGDCRVLLLTPGRGHFEALRPGFVLPLRWVAGDRNSPRLPPGLADEASRIVATDGPEFGIRPPPTGCWTLQLGGGLEAGCDLAQLDIDCDWSSARAALLAGLDLATLGAAPDNGVMASVAWNGTAFDAVDGVAAKLDAAADAGARTVFLAQANEADAHRWRVANAGSALDIRLLESRGTLRTSLGPYFQTIEARPSQEAPLSVLQRFYAHRLPRGPARWDFYVHSLAAGLARAYAGPRPLRAPCRNLIGIVAPGASPPLAFLAHLLTPSRVLLLHDSMTADDALKLEAHLRSDLGVHAVRHQCETFFGPLETCRAELAAAIGSFLASAGSCIGDPDTVIDLTGGTKRLTFLLLDLSDPRIVCVHLDNERSANGSVEQIGTEKVVAIRSAGPRG